MSKTEQEFKIDDTRDDLPFQIHWELDDAPLSVWAFRVYAHLVRCAGKNGAIFPSYLTIGEKCFRATNGAAANPLTLRNKAMAAMNELVDAGLVLKHKRTKKGSRESDSNTYALTPRRQWLEAMKTRRTALQQATSVADEERRAHPKPRRGGTPSVLGSTPTVPLGSTPSVPGSTPSVPKVTSIKVLQSFEVSSKEGGVSNVIEHARAQTHEADRPTPDLASAPRTTTDQASLQHNVAPERTPTAQALLEPPDTHPLEGPVPPDGGAAHAASDLPLTDEDLNELFAPENVDDTNPEKVPAAAGGAVPALRVADLVPVPRVELAERPAALPSGPEHRMIRSLVTGKQIDAGLLEQATPTGGLSRQDWLRLTLDEIGLVKTAAQSEAQAEGTGFVTLAIRGLDRMIGAVRREAPGQGEAGGQNPDAVARYDPKLPVGVRCTVAGQLGVVWQVTHAAYLIDLDDGERTTVDRAVAAQLRRLKASTAPAPSGPISQPAQPDALGALGSKWQPKAGGDPLEVAAIEGATRVMSDGSRVPVYALTTKFIPA